jgi:hypothetical protein
MKKMILAVLAASFVGASAQAQTYYPIECSLDVSSYDIAVGQAFEFYVSVFFEPTPYFQYRPIQPENLSGPPYTVTFYGFKDGAADSLVPYTHHSTIGNFGILTGYGNPGGIAGNYNRRAEIWNANGYVCTTNDVNVILR